MEVLHQITFGNRLQVVARAIRGLFKTPTANDLVGLYAGMFPGTQGSPPARGMKEIVASYGEMPWVHAVVGKIASGVAAAEWKVYIARNRDGDVRARPDLQRADYRMRKAVTKKLAKSGELHEIQNHPLPQVLQSSDTCWNGQKSRDESTKLMSASQKLKKLHHQPRRNVNRAPVTL
jgi:hypothetical protein